MSGISLVINLFIVLCFANHVAGYCECGSLNSVVKKNSTNPNAGKAAYDLMVSKYQGKTAEAMLDSLGITVLERYPDSTEFEMDPEDGCIYSRFSGRIILDDNREYEVSFIDVGMGRANYIMNAVCDFFSMLAYPTTTEDMIWSSTEDTYETSTENTFETSTESEIEWSTFPNTLDGSNDNGLDFCHDVMSQKMEMRYVNIVAYLDNLSAN